MRSNRTKWMAYNGLLLAVILVLTFVPNIGYIMIPPLPALTIIHVPVIIGGILFGYKSALFLSTAFGLSSLFVAATRGASAIDLLFINPLVSVLPRILFGLAIVVIYNVVKNLIKNKDIQVGITAFLSSLAHSIVVLTAIFISLGLQDGSLGVNTLTSIIGAIVFGSALAEAVLATLITVPVVKALRRIVD